MQQYLTQISHCPLFAHISSEDILKALTLLSAKVIHVKKGGPILLQGTSSRFFGILLDGTAHIVTGDVSGNHTLIAALHPSDLFAETFAFSGISVIPVSIIAAQDCTALLVDRSCMTRRQQSDFPAHPLLFANLIHILSKKNLQFSQKITILSQRTTRDKLIAYLLTQQRLAGSARFTIPFNRQELADYLCVDRSAMSAEISKMKKAGMIACRKNEFEILSLNHEDLPTNTPV